MRVAIFLSAVTTGVFGTAGFAAAQQPTGHVALGISAQEALKPAEALQHYRAALAQDSLNYEANWRAAVAAIEVAQQPAAISSAPTPKPAAAGEPKADTASADAEASEPEPADPDSLYTAAEAYARRALEIDHKNAAGHLAVAFALGSRSLISDPLTRLSIAHEIWQESSDAIAIDPKNDGAYHILGQWYAEIMRLGDFERGYAKSELGDIVTSATWALALKNLEKAVELAPSTIYHRLDLARAYLDTKRADDARAQISKIEALPVTNVRDPEYKTRAKTLLEDASKTP